MGALKKIKGGNAVGMDGIVIEMLKNGGFRSDRGYMDQILLFKQLVEKYREKRKELYVALMHLEKAYDKVCRKKTVEDA